MRLITALLLLLLPMTVHAADAVARLAGLLAGAKSLEAGFEQTITGANGAVSQRSTGTMTVARPQLFRWEVRTPFEQLIVADGKQVQVYDADLAQVVVRPFTKQLSETPALLFSGDAKRIGESFEVRVLDEKDGEVRFELKPRSADALFESLRVSFGNGQLREMALVDSLGQRTRIAFRDVKLNPAVPASRFTFTPPPGTDIVREGD